MFIRSLMLYFSILIFPYFLVAQENTALNCGDGIDNDLDGFIDCLDNDCLALNNNGCGICGEGISFADVLLAYNPGCPLVDPDPEGALGVSDWDGTVTDVPSFVFLGQGGSIKLGFTNNYITNSGTNELDLWIFEVGPAIEESNLALRPLDAFTTTQLLNIGLPDSNLDGFYELGSISGSTAGMDIDAILPGYASGALKFDAIEIQDVPDLPCGTSVTPGADIDAVCALSFVVVDCAGMINGIAVYDECGECLEPIDPNFNQSCADCAGTPNGIAIIDECGLCLEPDDPSFNQSCADCAGTPNGLAIIDECGLCLEPNDPNFNQSCVDCAGIINGTAEYDDCGECLALTDSNFNQSCADCAGEPNGDAIIDDCGDCLKSNDPNFNQSCADCAGIAFGTAKYNDCGECLEESDKYYNASCSEKYRIFIPNIFSPNGDGINDIFQLSAADGIVEEIIRYQIFDRWGELIFENERFLIDSNLPWWNGDFQNKKMQPAVFVYKIEVLFGNGDLRVFSGDVTLLK